MHLYDLIFVVLCLGMIFGLPGIFIFLIEYLSRDVSNSIRLSFDDFCLLYKNNPSKFGLDSFAPYVCFEEYPDIRFTLLGHIKYKIWRRKLRQNAEQNIADERQKRYLDFINDEINI